MLRDGEGYVLAVIRASERLDPKKAASCWVRTTSRGCDRAGDGRGLRAVRAGGAAPFGPILEVEQIVDRRLLDHERLCSAGDHRHSVKLDPNEMVRLASAQVGDLVED